MNDAAATPRIATLRWLVRLRALMIAASLLAILIAWQGFGLALPLPPLLGILAGLAALNVVAALRLRRAQPPAAWELPAQLLADLAALTVLLAYTGGWSNPFVFLFLLPLAVGAAAIPGRAALLLLAAAIGCYTALTLLSLGEPGHHPHPPGFDLHLWGMWACFVVSAVIITAFLGHASRALRERERQLAAARERALRDEQVVALGALAAGAAHELGTPLGTMAVLLGELRRRHEADELRDDVELLQSQVYRCKEILGRLADSAGEPRADGGGAEAVGDYLRALLADWQQRHPGLLLDTRIDPGAGPAIVVDRTLSQALRNVLDNAAQASPREVSVHAHWDDDCLQVSVLDRGPGIPDSQRALLGRQPVPGGNGLGVGLYLTAATLSRLGGELRFEPRPDGPGTCVRLTLPLTRLKVAA